jgi:hypothetical protein
MPDGRYLWICDIDQGLGEHEDETFLVGHYDSEGEIIAHGEQPNLKTALAWCADAA